MAQIGRGQGRPGDVPTYIEVTDVRGFQALVLVPTNLSESVNGKLPTIIFLHGIDEIGNDLGLLRRSGFPRNLEGDQNFPFIFIMPQCPASTEWYYTNEDNVAAMRTFIDDMVARFPVDTNRLYLTGLSMGGIGSWYYAIMLPTSFAAVVPVSFRGDGWSPAPAIHIPIWAFHGAKDGVIPLTRAQDLVDQFTSLGGTIRFTVYPEGGHDSSTWGVAYHDADVYDWLLRKTKQAPGTLVAPSYRPEDSFILHLNFPDPFNSATAISFTLNESGHVNLEVFDIFGRRVAVLIDEHRSAGLHRAMFDGSALSSGIYLAWLRAGSSLTVERMVILR